MRLVAVMFMQDIVARLRDRSAIVMGLLAPLGLIIILSFLVQGPDTGKQPIGYVPATSPTAVDQLLRTAVFPQMEREEVLTLHAFRDRAAAVVALNDEDVDAGIAVTATAGGGADLEVLRRPDAEISGSIAEGIARVASARVNGVSTALAALGALGAPEPGAPAAASSRIAAALAGAPPPVVVRDGAQEAGGLDMKTQMAAGMATFFLFFTVQFGLLGLLQERRQGTLARLLAAPVRPAQILAAKLLVSFSLGVLSMVALFVVSHLLLGARFDNPIGVAALIVTGVAAATSTVALVVGIARTADQAGMAQSMIALVLGLVGGSFFSMVRSGGVAAVATKLTPHYWFSEGLTRMSGGEGWTAALIPAGILLVFAAVIGIPGILLARRTVRP